MEELPAPAHELEEKKRKRAMKMGRRSFLKFAASSGSGLAMQHWCL